MARNSSISVLAEINDFYNYLIFRASLLRFSYWRVSQMQFILKNPLSERGLFCLILFEDFDAQQKTRLRPQ